LASNRKRGQGTTWTVASAEEETIGDPIYGDNLFCITLSGNSEDISSVTLRHCSVPVDGRIYFIEFDENNLHDNYLSTRMDIGKRLLALSRCR
jgi:hypothetical protein